MKSVRNLYLCTILLFAFLLIFANLLLHNNSEVSSQGRNVVMNRIADLVEKKYADGETDVTSVINKIYYQNRNDWEQEYDEKVLPEQIIFLTGNVEPSGVNSVTNSAENQNIWALYHDNNLVGFLLFRYDDNSLKQMAKVVYLCIIGSFCLVIGVILYVHYRILKPFWNLSAYPERLSKGDFAENLPETPNRYFGRFIWGVNMLRDKLSTEKKYSHRLMKEKQTLLASIAHGIKTPVSNIKLYASAIETGLYQPNGKSNKEDSEIAAKINRNADDIAVLVQELIQRSTDGLVDFVPTSQSFYTTELKEYIEVEYSNRLNILRIPYEVQCNGKTIIQSDKNGVIRILSQLIENAIKYGDGTHISIQIEKQDDGHYLTVKNNGNPISENEMPYIFNCFWRGSNTEENEGSGIGLYEAKQIAKRLSGDIFVKSSANEVEFLVYIPL